MFRWDTVQRTEDGRVLLLYRHRRIFEEGIVRAGMDVLDIGGWGVFASAVIEHGARCTILDLFTPDQAYPERVRALPHVEGDARNRNCFPDKSFDVVTCFEMLEHCGDIPAVLANARAWLRTAGTLVGTIPIPGAVHPADEPGISFLTSAQLRAALEGAGLVDVVVEPTASVHADDEPCSLYFHGRCS